MSKCPEARNSMMSQGSTGGPVSGEYRIVKGYLLQAVPISKNIET